MAMYMREKEFQAAVRELAKACGWASYCTWDSRHSPPGWPDLVLLRGDRALFRELKTNQGKLTPEQTETLERLTAAGLDAGVWRPSDWPEIERALMNDGPALSRVSRGPRIPPGLRSSEPI